MQSQTTLRGLAVAGLFATLAAGPLAAPAVAQSNSIPGTDVALGILSSFSFQGRQGAFPTGVNAFAMATTSCNLGTVNVPWLEPMNENHPTIAFLAVREDAGGTRLRQISDRSFLKHGFFALSSSQCTPCQVPSNGTFLGIGCSDTYSVGNNANNFYLAPADEVDPWLGAWEATCSFFDAGLTPVPATQCDGQRSFSFAQSNSLGPVGNRVRVDDRDLIGEPGTRYYYASQYVVRGEPEAVRTNNIGSREFNPNWNGSSWSVPTVGALLQGTVLQRWTGATVSSNTNGTFDGRVYVAVKVSGPVDGVYHYEYALHNRDSHRGVGEIRLPVCAGADVQNVGFGDLDDDTANDWSVTVEGGELVLSGPSNAVRWNTVYNVWFDSTAAPTAGAMTLVAADAGAGPGSFDVATTVPGSAYAVKTGDGCSDTTPAASLAANGLPSLGNNTFALLSEGLPAGAPLLLFGSPVAGTTPLGTCTLLLGGNLGTDVLFLGTGAADGTGVGSIPLPIPNLSAIDGLTYDFQVIVVSGSGPLFDVAELSDGLRVRFGALLTGCL